jgi:hypothetical protein
MATSYADSQERNMDAINLADAGARLSELDIVRRGKSDAGLTAATKPCRDVDVPCSGT